MGEDLISSIFNASRKVSEDAGCFLRRIWIPGAG